MEILSFQQELTIKSASYTHSEGIEANEHPEASNQKNTMPQCVQLIASYWKYCFLLLSFLPFQRDEIDILQPREVKHLIGCLEVHFKGDIMNRAPNDFTGESDSFVRRELYTKADTAKYVSDKTTAFRMQADVDMRDETLKGSAQKKGLPGAASLWSCFSLFFDFVPHHLYCDGDANVARVFQIA